MNITKSTVEKIIITGAERFPGCGSLDPISVIVEDFGPGQGKITITCFGEAWSHYWSHMGETNKLMQFFTQCDNDYIVGKLKTGISHEIDDEDDDRLTELLRKEIIKDRRSGDLRKEIARDYWDDTQWVSWDSRADLCYKILGDDWWYMTPKKPNPDYLYLCEIIRAIKAAFNMNQETA